MPAPAPGLRIGGARSAARAMADGVALIVQGSERRGRGYP
jgi:hypothetical protein